MNPNGEITGSLILIVAKIYTFLERMYSGYRAVSLELSGLMNSATKITIPNS